MPEASRGNAAGGRYRGLDANPIDSSSPAKRFGGAFFMPTRGRKSNDFYALPLPKDFLLSANFSL